MQSAAARNLGEGLVTPSLDRPGDESHGTDSERGDVPRRGQKVPTIMGP